MSQTAASLPSHAHVVIIGGGVMGCGLLYHLTHEGWRDIVLLEKAELTSGSTWHAAGQVTYATSSHSLGKCVGYTVGLYSGALEKETGQSVTWHGCGSFRLAYDEDEMDWLRYTFSIARGLGFNIELVEPDFVARKHPFYNLAGVVGALYTPDDGHADPSGVTLALARGARNQGARIIRRCRATNISQRADGAWLVATTLGDIVCEHVVNAGGTYARQMGEWSGLQLPMTSMTHHYFVTDDVPQFAGLETELPVVRDDRQVSGYIRMEQRAGLVGIYEKENTNAVWVDACPWEAENELFDADYDRVMPWLENAMQRMPVLARVGIRRVVHGAISHPPDGNPLIGPAPGVKNYWCCCGTQIGIGWGPGLTRELARWMVHGAADISMRAYDPRRFGAYADRDWQVLKAHEDYKLRHEIPFPHFNRLAGRPVKPSPLYDTLKAKGAVFEEVYGFERPRWFARNGVTQRDQYSFRRNALHDIVAGEVRNVRTRVGIMDVTAFAKVAVCGSQAETFLDRLSPNNLPKVGRIALTHLLGPRGRIEIELTIARLTRTHFYLVCAAFFEQRLCDHLNHRLNGEDVKVVALSSSRAALALNGPRARDVLAACTGTPPDNQNFPLMSARKIEIAGHEVWALRLSCVGETGWEFHMPFAAARDVYHALWTAGEAHEIADYGAFAMNVMRMEKMFPGADELTNEVTLPQAGVMRFVNMNKDFEGRVQTQADLHRVPPWTCAYLEIEPDGVVDGHGGEAVFHHAEVVGATASVVYGHTVGKILAFAYIKPAAAVPGTRLRVLIAARERNATVLCQAAYDPQNLERVMS